MKNRLRSQQSGIIGTLLILVLAGAGAFFLWKTWEANQIQFETGTASELASSSTIASSKYAPPQGYTTYGAVDIPFTWAVPENWEISEANVSGLANTRAAIRFASPENKVSYTLIIGDSNYTKPEEFIDAIENNRTSGAIKGEYQIQSIDGKISGIWLFYNYKNKTRQTFYFIYGDREYRFEMSENLFNTNSEARNVFYNAVSTLNLLPLSVLED